MEDIEQGGYRGRESEGVNKYIGREVGGERELEGKRKKKKQWKRGSES